MQYKEPVANKTEVIVVEEVVEEFVFECPNGTFAYNSSVIGNWTCVNSTRECGNLTVFVDYRFGRVVCLNISECSINNTVVALTASEANMTSEIWISPNTSLVIENPDDPNIYDLVLLRPDRILGNQTESDGTMFVCVTNLTRPIKDLGNFPFVPVDPPETRRLMAQHRSVVIANMRICPLFNMYISLFRLFPVVFLLLCLFSLNL